MARLEKSPYSIQVGSETRIVQLNESSYKDIAQYVGLRAIAGKAPDGAKHGNVSQLLLDGQIAKVRISYIKTVGNTQRYRTADIICDLDNYKTAIGILPGKTYRSSKIISAFIPRRRKLG